jgi:AcrR family transcriptional regulator
MALTERVVSDPLCGRSHATKLPGVPNLPTRTSPRQARSAKSLDLILDAAEQLFHQRGVAETSTVDVASAAKVSVGRLYYWFPDKDAVTNAVMQRSEQRLREFLGSVIVHDPDTPTPDLLDRVIPLVGEFFKQHPGSLAVLMRGPVDPVDHGRSMCQYMESLAAAVVELRVPGVPAAERDLVAATITSIVLGILSDFVSLDDEAGRIVLDELRYVLAAYLHCRYPGHLDPVWANPAEPIRPSRRPVRFERPSKTVYPALTEPAVTDGVGS